MQTTDVLATWNAMHIDIRPTLSHTQPASRMPTCLTEISPRGFSLAKTAWANRTADMASRPYTDWWSISSVKWIR